MKERIVKALKYKSLDGLSEKQISEHHDILYTGYVKKINEIRSKLVNVDRETANATFSDLRELKIEETFAINGVKLHEGYFDNLGSKKRVNGDILKMIERDFGNFENWQKDFLACGLSAHG